MRIWESYCTWVASWRIRSLLCVLLAWYMYGMLEVWLWNHPHLINHYLLIDRRSKLPTLPTINVQKQQLH